LELIKLVLTFAKIGLFSFGGGYAMIPIIQQEIESNNWLTSAEFVDIIAIAEMTPGPIAVNSATFVGYKISGVWGGILATFGVALPSFILAVLISSYYLKFKRNRISNSIFYGIRPVITALVLSATVVIAETCLIRESFFSAGFKEIMKTPLAYIDVISLGIIASSLIVLKKFKIHPIGLIFLSGILGVFFY